MRLACTAVWARLCGLGGCAGRGDAKMVVRRLPVHPAISGPLLAGTRELFVTAHFSLLVRGAAPSAICCELFQPGRAILPLRVRCCDPGPSPFGPCPLAARLSASAPGTRFRAFRPCRPPPGLHPALSSWPEPLWSPVPFNVSTPAPLYSPWPNDFRASKGPFPTPSRAVLPRRAAALTFRPRHSTFPP